MDCNQKKRIIMCTLICCSFMLFVSLYYKLNRKAADPQTGNLDDKADENSKRVKRSKWSGIFKYSKVCATKKCQQFGNQFKRIIDKSVDPCDDFYAFVCDKFQRNDEMTTDLITLRTAAVEVDLIMKEDLSEPISNTDPKSVRYAANMFKGCVDSKTLESRGVQPLIGALKTIGGWPLIQQILSFDEENYNPLDALAKMISLFAQSGIIEVSIGAHPTDNTKKIIIFASSPDLLLRENIFENMLIRDRAPTHQSFRPKHKMRPISEREGNSFRQPSLQDYQYIMQKVVIMGGTDNQDNRQQIVELFDFSLKLIQVQQSPANQNSTSNVFLTFKQFNELSSNQIDWLQFANKIYSLLNSKQRFNQDDICFVPELEYFRQLSQILSQTPNRVIANFLGFKLVSWFGDYTVEAFRDLDYGNQVPSWYICLDLMTNNMDLALSRKYIDKHFSQTTKIEASKLVDFIQDAFYKLIETNKILDESSRNKSLIKLRAVTKNVGYPDWLLDDQTLDAQYDLRKECQQKAFFECIVYLMRRKMFVTFDSINKAVNLTIASWYTDLIEVNAAYILPFNSITITAAIINEFFAKDNPAQINYAKLGTVIGHELTHGFDPSGSQFDERGNVGPIWDMLTQSRFDEKEQCFTHQYNNYCEFGFCVDGQNTLNENIADNGGILEAYSAYIMHNQYNGESMRLPDVSQYTPHQLFFISYATTWCDNMSPEEAKEFSSDDVHSPAKFRVNGVLANDISFATAFNCPINSTMNPINKCILW